MTSEEELIKSDEESIANLRRVINESSELLSQLLAQQKARQQRLQVGKCFKRVLADGSVDFMAHIKSVDGCGNLCGVRVQHGSAVHIIDQNWGTSWSPGEGEDEDYLIEVSEREYVGYVTRTIMAISSAALPG